MKGLCHVCMSSNKDVEINSKGVAFCGDCTESEKQ